MRRARAGSKRAAGATTMRSPPSKQNHAKLLIADPHGGVDPTTFAWLRALGERARKGRDVTVYDAHSPHAFVAHHGTRISYACVRGEADTFRAGLDALERAHVAGAA